MNHFIINNETGKKHSKPSRFANMFVDTFANKGAATREMNSKGLHDTHKIVSADEMPEPKMVTRINLMTGEEFTEAENAPRCCSPASELYWSM